MKIFLTLWFTLVLIKLPGQTNDDSWKALNEDGSNFYSVKNSFDSYLSQKYHDTIPQDKLSNIKSYYRNTNFWKSRLSVKNNNISFTPYIQAINSVTSQSYCTTSDPANWELLGPSNLSEQYNGLVTQVLNDPNNADSYLLSSDFGGVWKNQTTGNTWKNVTDDLRMPGVACSEMIRNPFNSNHIFASTASGCNFIGSGGYGQGIIESFDNGNTWSVMSGFPNQNYPFLEKIIADPNDINPSDGLTLYAIGNQTLYKSTNTGTTWTTIIFPPNLLNQYTHLLDIEIDNTGTLFLTTYSLYDNSSGQILKFKNNIWADISNLFPDFQRCLLSKPYNGKIFALVDNSIRTIYKTLDYGVTWTFVKSGGCLSPGYKKEIEYSPTSGLVYIGDIYYICFNENTPTMSMCILPGHMDIRDIVFLGIDANGYENTLVATDGGISKVKVKVQNVNDNSYTNLNGNYLPIEEFMGLGVSKSSSEFIVAGAVHNNSFKYQNGTWTKFATGDGGDCEVNWDDPSIYYYQGNSLMRNNSGTFYYSTINDWFIGMEFELHPNKPYIVYAGRKKTSSSNAKLLIFDEHGGSTGNGLLTTKFAPPDVSAIGSIGINKNNTIYIADYGGSSESTPYRFAKSTGNGDTWTDLSNKIVYKKSGSSWVQYGTLGVVLAWKTIEDIIFNPSNPDEMWISIGGMSPDNLTGFMRVLHSTDGGNTLYDYSENLPPFPVMALEYQLGSNNRLFAGTDAGVFYRDSTMVQWECFSKGLPVSIVSDLDYDPCSRYLYASTRGRSIFKTLVPFDDNTTTSLPANSIIIWDEPVQLANNLIVPENTTLTITSNVYVSKNKKIIIKPNGKLIVNGGKITNGCGSHWQGIEVWGTTTQHQYPVNGVCAQGTVELKNDAVIENAYNGITNWKPDDWNSIGGIIKAENSTFKNCRRAVEFMKYRNFDPSTGLETDNVSNFSNCTFDVTDAYPSGASPFVYHVSLWQVKGITFSGCDFLNNRANNFTGTGILSLDAGYKVLPITGTTVDKSFFKNFATGISASNSETVNIVYVNNAKFTNNGYGISLQSIPGATVLNSLFEIGTSPNCPNQGYGISMYACSGYTIQENTFTGVTTTGTTFKGISITSSGSAYNEIYKNTFQNLNTGNVASLQNGASYPPNGLTYLCNTNTGNKYDFSVNSASSISPFQCSVTFIASGNTFSPYATLHFANGGSYPVQYYYPSIPEQTPVSYYGLQLFQTANTNTCLSKIDGSKNLAGPTQPEMDAKELEFAEALSAYNNVKALYESLIDGGSTPNTVQDIENSIPSEMWELRKKLLGESPHLSQEALKVASLKTDVLPQSVLFEILAANPDEMRDDKFLSFLQTKDNPLPDYMIDLLRQIAGNKSYKTILLEKLNMYDNLKTSAASDIISSKQHASIVDLPGIINWLDNKGDLASHYQMVDAYLQSGNTGAAESMLKLIPGLHKFTANDSVEYQNLVDLKTLQINIRSKDDKLSRTDSVVKAKLTNIANSTHGIASAQAHGLLEFWYGVPYCNCITNDDQLKHAAVKQGNQLSMPSAIKISANPNPATTWITFDFELPDGMKNVNLIILDAQGRTVDKLTLTGRQGQKLLDIRNYSPGIYIYKSDNNEKVMGKFIVK